MQWTIWTIGHSTRTIDEFTGVLAAYDIELVADVRRYPGSRRVPQFGEAALESSLAARGVAYRWISSLGGRRRTDPGSVNLAWRHQAFRAYADHIATEEFADGLFDLLMLSGGLRTVMMCAEILWWRCHRRIIADVLTSIGMTVVHIRDERNSSIHRLGAPGRMAAGRLTYAKPRS
jgi:uncharacterized protein (DUF488 family)